jgi:hypothetical protein
MLLLNTLSEEEEEEEVHISQKTQHLYYKYIPVNGFTKIILIYCENHTKQIH